MPWRKTKDPYRIWISEVMLQQTTVRAVIPYYERWLERFPDLRSLARASLRDVLRAWQGLGYYQRARNLHRAAGAMTREHAGLIPDDAAALRKLPGFGPYTTAAVLSLAYGRPLPLIDANVRRVLMRILAMGGAASSAGDKGLLKHLQEIIPLDAPGAFNQALMELGALVCRSANPQCLLCPVREFCRAAAEGTQETIPRPRRLEVAKIEAAVAVILRDGRFLIRRRPDKGLLAGLWEFPGGKREGGESLVETLRREVREEVGAGIEGVRFLTTVGHAYTRFQVTLHVYSCRFRRVPALPAKDFRWVTLRSIRRYPLPSGSVRIVDFLAR
ncbi:MAG: A/G-specific adenine glycosylase, partial [Candidatus Aminicenantes bacterium]